MKKEIGRRIRLLRLEKGYTQINVAESVSICESTYRSIEAGKASLDISLLDNILRELNEDFYNFIAELRNFENT